MKKYYTSLALISLFFTLTAFVYKQDARLFMPPPGDTVLVLPEDPYDYESVSVPSFLMQTYIWGGETDTTILSLVTDEGATLGRVLFYDNKLSLNNDQNCGSCHKQEFSFADSERFSEGLDGELSTRNTPQLNDLSWGPAGQAFFWDMKIHTLEDAVLQPIINPSELSLPLDDLIERLEETDYYGPLFEAAFGTPQVSAERIGKALSQFVASYVSFESKFDEGAGMNSTFSNFTTSEANGRVLFLQDCAICHQTNSSFVVDAFDFNNFVGNFNNGLDSVFTDLGMGGWTGDSSLDGLFKSPSLKNIAFTAPYMHDGRFETLEDVVDFYSEGILPNENSHFNTWNGQSFTGFDYSDQEKANLVAFLHTLTDENLLTNPKWSNPFQSVTGTEDIPLALKTARLYPNPMADYTTLYLSNPEARELTLRLSTVDGKLIKQWTAKNEEIRLDREGLLSGIYFLSMTQDGRVRSLRLVVE